MWSLIQDLDDLVVGCTSEMFRYMYHAYTLYLYFEISDLDYSDVDSNIILSEFLFTSNTVQIWLTHQFICL